MPRPPRAARRVLVILLLVAALPAPPARGAGAPLDAYRGLGAWVDIFDTALYQDPEGTVATLSAQGVRTLFLETTSYRFPGPLRFPDLAGRFLDAAHATGMRVVGWYVPDFVDMQRDLSWSLAAIDFVSAGGQRFDSFALDIEVTELEDPNERASRVLELAQAIRQAVGPGYPLGAITPSPLRSPGFWPVFPDVELAQTFDVYLPMAYWSFSREGEAGAYEYISQSIATVRADTQRPDLPIHVIGGEADGADALEMNGFVKAVNEAGILGASMYDAALSGAEDWTALGALAFPEPEAAPAPAPGPEPDEPAGLRLGVDLGTYGTLAGADRRYEDQVVFEAGPMPGGGWELDLEAFGIEKGAATVLVNGEVAGEVAPSGRDRWGARTTLTLPAGLLREDSGNRVAIAVDGGGEWAVREVSAAAPPLPLDDVAAHGGIPTSDPGRADRVTYRFSSPATPLAIDVLGFDVARGEVVVILDGRTVGSLAATAPRVWGEPQALVLEPWAAGEHTLTFDAVGAAGDPWAVRVDGDREVAFA